MRLRSRTGPEVARPKVEIPPRQGGPGQGEIDIVGIGVSTGGPNALNELFRLLPDQFPVPIVIVQHMPPLFTRLLSEQLNERTGLTVKEAGDGDELIPDGVWVAPGDLHLAVTADGGTVKTRVFEGPKENSCRPAVDVLFRSLAEPSLLAASGDSASFLAGGEFPYPVLQGGTASNAVTIQFKEFGIRLNFKPVITNSGMIRLQVRPEVSQLDFANATQIAGFLIPSLLARRAETTVELADGQTFAIAGLVDNSMAKAINKVPILGDIPILGYLFKSEEFRQNRTELLVLVTPRLVEPMDEAPPLPTGEPDTWERNDELRIDETEILHRSAVAGSAGLPFQVLEADRKMVFTAAGPTRTGELHDRPESGRACLHE